VTMTRFAAKSHGEITASPAKSEHGSDGIVSIVNSDVEVMIIRIRASPFWDPGNILHQVHPRMVICILKIFKNLEHDARIENVSFLNIANII